MAKRKQKNKLCVISQWFLLLVVIFMCAFLWKPTRLLLLGWYTQYDNVFHPSYLGKNQTVVIPVENDLPFKMDYVVIMKLIFINGQKKVNENKNEYKKHMGIIGLNNGKSQYPINLKLTIFKVENGNKLKSYTFDLSNDSEKTFNASSYSQHNSENSGYTVTLKRIEKLPSGRYLFEIEDLSKRVRYFDEIIAEFKIQPDTRIQ